MTRPTNCLIAKFLFLLVGVLGAVACSGGDEIKWTEEVRLHDGKIIQVKRRVELTASGFPVQRRGRTMYHELCYPPMGIYWKSRPAYRPENFDLVNGRAYVRVTLRDCSHCMLHDYPQTGALYFVWEGGTWKRIDSNAFPKQLRLNLIQSPTQGRAADDARGLVTLAEKDRFDISLSYEMRALGARWLTDLPSYRDMCTKCKAINTQTDRTSEIFLSSKSTRCDW